MAAPPSTEAMTTTPPAAMTTTSPAPPAPRLAGWREVWARLTLVVVVMGSGLALFFRVDHNGDIGRTLAWGVVAYSVALVVVAFPAAVLLSRPMKRLQQALDVGTVPSRLDPNDVVRALRLPHRVFGVVVAFGLVVAIVFAVAADGHRGVWAPWGVFLTGGVAVAVISGAAHAYALRWLVVRQLAPLLLPEGRLDHLGDDVDLTPTWHHLLLLTATLGICWPTLGYLVLTFGINPSQSAAAVMLVLYIAMGAHQITGILASVSRPVGHLRDRMILVRDGSLQTRARIDALDTFGRLSSEFNRMVEGLQQRELLKETFGRYVTKQVADEILSGRVALGGERRQATVLFSDIRGFTEMSERLSPEEVVAFLNEYLTIMVDCVLEHGGVLDKFIGDAVLAVFGVPVSQGSLAGDAKAAVACAQAMGRRLDELNSRRANVGLTPIRIGIGVHTGDLVAGNIGSPKRMQYTVIGDTVNVGSRLEALTKEHQRRTLLSGATADLVKDEVDLEALGTVPVRGRKEALAIYGIRAEAAMT